MAPPRIEALLFSNKVLVNDNLPLNLDEYIAPPFSFD